MHFLLLNAQEKKEDRTEDACLWKGMKGPEMGKRFPLSATDTQETFCPAPVVAPLALAAILNSGTVRDSEQKTKHPLRGRGRKGTTASPWERVRVNRKSQHLPVCLPSSLCGLWPWSRQKKAPATAGPLLVPWLCCSRQAS